MHTDVPTRSDIDALLAVERPGCVTIYRPTSPLSQEAQADRIAFANQAAAARDALTSAGLPAADVGAVEEALGELAEDYDFWSEQARSLAVFATPERVLTFRLPNRLTEAVRVSDRFAVKPLLRAVSFPQAAFVLALAQGATRLVEVTADGPGVEIAVPGMPDDVAGAVGKASIADRAPSGRIQGTAGQKVRMRQYARAVDRALRPVLAGSELPLVLAATQPLDAIFRSVTTYPHLAQAGIEGSPERTTDAELGQAARVVLDGLHAAQLAALRGRLASGAGRGRSATDLGDVARAATFGAVDTLMVDMDAHVPGSVDAASGAVDPAADPRRGEGVTDEIARRTLDAGGRVVAVRAEDLPGPSPVAALLRHPV